jgi:FlaA1/EpsC-like NDP-sugar epimerase
MFNPVPHGVHDATLLGREPVIAYGPEARAMVAGRRMLVTGAGGSIGSELVRQLAQLEPAEIFLVDHDESLMHAVQLEVFGDGQLVHERTILADIRDRQRLGRLFIDARPDIVFHAAAHKHVAILERYPSEAIRTNVLGTDNVIRATELAGAERLVFVSTDKAANPTTVLGASKRLAETLIQQAASDTLRTASVRFGNVLGSRGSFLHTLDHQLRTGQPVTITDPHAERYFMTIPEAAALVIEASVGARQGETYLLDMGDPVRITELVYRYVTTRNVEMPEIVFTGMSPGEKISETLIDPCEVALPTNNPRITQVPNLGLAKTSARQISRLYVDAISGDEEALRESMWSCLRSVSDVSAALDSESQLTT